MLFSHGIIWIGMIEKYRHNLLSPLEIIPDNHDEDDVFLWMRNKEISFGTVTIEYHKCAAQFKISASWIKLIK